MNRTNTLANPIRSALALVVLALPAACGGVEEAGDFDEAEDLSAVIVPMPPIPPDYCIFASANATLTLSGPPYAVDVVSPSNAYATTSCGHYVVDISITDTPNSNYLEAAFIAGYGVQLPANPLDCVMTRLDERIYQRFPVGWSLVSGTTYSGSWQSGSCRIGSTRTVPTPANRFDEYRVATRLRNIATGGVGRVGAGASYVRVPF